MTQPHEHGQQKTPGATRPERPTERPATPGVPTRADIERDQAANDTRIQTLAAHGVQIDQASLMRVRLGQLVEQLLGDMDSPARLEHERRCNAMYAQMIADVESQVARARLLQGVQLGNSNGRPG